MRQPGGLRLACLLLLLLHSIVGGSSDVAVGPLPLSQTCGWPSVHRGGLFGNATVRLAQRLLGHALGDRIVADGVFTSDTTTAIERFQTVAGLNGSGAITAGYLNAGTWPALVSTAAHNPVTGSRQLVLALQDALAATGYATPLTGQLDSPTRNNLAALLRERGPPGAAPAPPDMVSATTWHLLTTGCNSSVSGAFWFDAGWPQGNMTSEMLSCLHASGMEYATFECWVEQSSGPHAPQHSGSFWDGCVGNIARAQAAGFAKVGAYMFPGRNGDPAAQATWLLGNLTVHAVRFENVMLDVEGADWSQHTAAENAEFMLAIKRVFDDAGVKITVYAGRQWPSYFGNKFSAFAQLPLVYAHYDLVPSFCKSKYRQRPHTVAPSTFGRFTLSWNRACTAFTDMHAPESGLDDFPAGSYGGWSVPAGKQFWDGQEGERLCGTGALDWDWSPEPFW